MICRVMVKNNLKKIIKIDFYCDDQYINLCGYSRYLYNGCGQESAPTLIINE